MFHHLPQRILKTSMVALTAAFSLVALAQPVSAVTVNTETPNHLFDNFTDFTYGTPGYLDFVHFDFNFDFLSSNPTWWVALNNGPYRFYNIPCSTFTKPDSTVIGTNTECLTHEGSGGSAFMRLSLKANPGWQTFDYNDIALTDSNDGFSYSLPKRWLPEVGRPVTVTAKMRWDEHYHADGTGGFRGSSGVYLWNMPADYVAGVLHPPKAFGFELLPTDAGAADPKLVGLGASTIALDEPEAGQQLVYRLDQFDRFQVLDVNINEWNDYKFEWSVDSEGVQHVNYWVGDRYIGEKTLDEAFPALSLEIWNDNYWVTPGVEGTFSVGTNQIVQEQNLDVQSINIFQHP